MRLFVLVGAAVVCAGCAASHSDAPPAESAPRLTSAPVASPEATTPASPPDPAPATYTDSSPPPEEKHTARNLRNAGWASLAIAGAAGALAIGSSIIMLSDDVNRSSNCNAHKVCDSVGYNANESLANNGVTNAVLWTVALSGAVVGAYFVITNPRDHARETAVGVAPNGAGANLALRGTF